jgi:hypothetical protein
MDLIYLHADNTMDSSNSSFVFIIITLLMLKNGSCLKATEWLTCQCTHNALAISDYQSLFMELKIFPKMLYNWLSIAIKSITSFTSWSEVKNTQSNKKKSHFWWCDTGKHTLYTGKQKQTLTGATRTARVKLNPAKNYYNEHINLLHDCLNSKYINFPLGFIMSNFELGSKDWIFNMSYNFQLASQANTGKLLGTWTQWNNSAEEVF